jgi:hypothetical protein
MTMRFPCKLKQSGGGWVAEHDGPDVGHIEIRADTRDAALEKLRGEIRYRLELCPCSGESYQHIEVNVIASAD